MSGTPGPAASATRTTTEPITRVRRSAGRRSPRFRARALRDKTRRRRAAIRAPEVEHFAEIEIFERDRWRCGICRLHVSRKLAWPHPRSASLDHIIPLSEHGPHTRANVRLAHLDCNVARSNKGGGEQLALIG